MQNVILTAIILEDESVEQGVCAAYLSRFVHTPASHVLDAIAEWLGCQNLILVSSVLLHPVTICIGKIPPDSQNIHEATINWTIPRILMLRSGPFP